MPTTVKAAFAELLTRIELNPTRVQLASQRYNAIKRVIESALPGKVVRQIGSFQRKTKIRPLDLSDALDVDALVSFGPAYNFSGAGENGVTTQRALQIVRSALSSNDIYRVMEPTTDAPVVVLEYADRTPFKIELAAGYVDKMGQRSHGQNGPECYLVAGAGGRWLSADYDYDAALISGANQQSFMQEALVPFIKIVKAYLRGKNIPLKSFYTEVLVALTIPPILLDWHSRQYGWEYHHMLAAFLQAAPQSLGNPLVLPGSFSDPVWPDLTAATVSAISTWMTAVGQEAWEICRVQNPNEAVRAWSSFFGRPFPSE